MIFKRGKSNSTIDKEIENRIRTAVAEEQHNRSDERKQRLEKIDAKLFRKIKPLKDAFKLIDAFEVNYRKDLCELALKFAKIENLSGINTSHVTRAKVALGSPQK